MFPREKKLKLPVRNVVFCEVTYRFLYGMLERFLGKNPSKDTTWNA